MAEHVVSDAERTTALGASYDESAGVGSNLYGVYDGRAYDVSAATNT